MLRARRAPQAEEEVRELQKKMQQLENDLDQTQEKLMNANQRLEEKEKALQNVSRNARAFLFSLPATFSGQGGGGGPPEKDGPARERADPDHLPARKLQQATGGAGEGAAERESHDETVWFIG